MNRMPTTSPSNYCHPQYTMNIHNNNRNNNAHNAMPQFRHPQQFRQQQARIQAQQAHSCKQQQYHHSLHHQRVRYRGGNGNDTEVEWKHSPVHKKNNKNCSYTSDFSPRKVQKPRLQKKLPNNGCSKNLFGSHDPNNRRTTSGTRSSPTPSSCPTSNNNKPQQQAPRHGIAVEGGPTPSDVVCCSINVTSPKRPGGIVVIQPRSTHEGNLRFCNLVGDNARSYKRARDEKEQKTIARSIAASITSRGGRFLVWIKENQSQLEHHNNGSWHVVDNEDVRNISRYALLKQAQAIGDDEDDGASSGPEETTAPATPRKQQGIEDEQQQQQPPRKVSPFVEIFKKASSSFHKPQERDHKEETTTATTPSLVEKLGGSADNECASVLEILTGSRGVCGGFDNDDDDLWSSSPGGGTASDEKDSQQLEDELQSRIRSSSGCWEYKILLPLTME